MAYTVKFLRSTEGTIEATIKAFLDGATPTTIHSIDTLKYGTQLFTVIVYE